MNACVSPLPWLLVFAGRTPVCVSLPLLACSFLELAGWTPVFVCTFLPLPFPLADFSNWLFPFSYLVVCHQCFSSLKLFPLTSWMSAYVCVYDPSFPLAVSSNRVAAVSYLVDCRLCFTSFWMLSITAG